MVMILFRKGELSESIHDVLPALVGNGNIDVDAVTASFYSAIEFYVYFTVYE